MQRQAVSCRSRVRVACDRCHRPLPPKRITTAPLLSSMWYEDIRRSKVGQGKSREVWLHKEARAATHTPPSPSCFFFVRNADVLRMYCAVRRHQKHKAGCSTDLDSPIVLVAQGEGVVNWVESSSLAAHIVQKRLVFRCHPAPFRATVMKGLVPMEYTNV